MTASNEETRDVFISFAGKDKARAEELVDHLDRLGCRCFISSRDIPLGKEWADALVTELEGTRSVAVLLSEDSLGAKYQRAEIDIAIDLRNGKRPDLEILPIFLEETTDPRIGLGLSGFQRENLYEIGPEAAAEKIAALLGKGPGEEAPEPGPDPEELRTFGAYFHRAALKIDRKAQWEPIKEICSGEENALFLLHGPRDQNLDLFIGRMWCYLAQECRSHHRCCLVPLRDKFARPQTAAGWETHLVKALSRSGRRRGGQVVDLLREAARRQRIFLIFGRHPIQAGDLEEHELGPAARLHRRGGDDLDRGIGWLPPPHGGGVGVLGPGGESDEVGRHKFRGRSLHLLECGGRVGEEGVS